MKKATVTVEFQFHNGSIKSDFSLLRFKPAWLVSIPQWFD